MSTGDFRVADISLADFGRKEIDLAEHEVRVVTRLTSFAIIYYKIISILSSNYLIDAWSHGVQKRVWYRVI